MTLGKPNTSLTSGAAANMGKGATESPKFSIIDYGYEYFNVENVVIGRYELPQDHF